MTEYERIRATLDRKPVDRLACDMWATDEVKAKLIAHTGSRDEWDLYDRLGIDKIRWVQAPYLDLARSPDGARLRDEWGVGFGEQKYAGGAYMERSYEPLARMESVAEYEAYAWPDPARFDYGALARSVREASVRSGSGRVCMLNFISLFEVYVALRSYESALMDLYAEKDLAHFALERICSIQLDYIERSLSAAGEGIDLVYFSDDMGMQDRQLFSTAVWEEFFAPLAGRIVDLVHSRGKKVFYHTDGSAPEIVDRLVDLGIDILNPIQHLCPGMERERLKKLYGKKVVFHGAVENQRVLPFGSPEDVRKETEDCMRILGGGGGYILASCHRLQPNTPLENILAMYETVRDCGAKYL
jgi:uroporphyrinogen decarboxylase